MAETIISPGVLARENDQSFQVAQPIQAGAAIIGPTVRGKIGIPTICTSYSDYTNKFGALFQSGSQNYSYLTSISSYNYFAAGGTSLLVTRVVSGSFTSFSHFKAGISQKDETNIINNDCSTNTWEY